jgi:uncharacterized membrane protein
MRRIATASRHPLQFADFVGTAAVNTRVVLDACAGGEGRRLVIEPNASLTPPQAVAFLGGMCLISFSIAGVFAFLGYWMVLPFAGLEMLALAAALWWVMRGNAYREVISIGSERVQIQAGRFRPERNVDFPRAWTRVCLEMPRSPCDRSRLLISHAGRRCEVGACLGEAQREALARRLNEILAAPVPARELKTRSYLGASACR